jgi:hypothetical protein
MVKDSSWTSSEIYTRALSSTLWLTDPKELLLIRKVINTLEPGNSTKSMEWELRHGKRANLGMRAPI